MDRSEALEAAGCISGSSSYQNAINVLSPFNQYVHV